MTVATLAGPAPDPAPAPAGFDLDRIFRDEPRFAVAAILLALLTLPTLMAYGFDTRLVDGQNPWLKPLKFELALSLFLATLALYARLLPEGFTETRAWRGYSVAVVAAIGAEMVWLFGASLYGVRAHFNTDGGLMQALYGVAGILAVTFSAAMLVFGVTLLRRGTHPMAPAVGWSLLASFLLTLTLAGYMSNGTSHLVGKPVTGAALPVLGWSREVGDLRIAHFMATHAMHFVPLVALALPRGHRTALLLVAGYTALAVAAFARALAGLPLF